MGAAGAQFRHLLRLAVDAVLPPLCLSCGAMVAEPGALCAACWERIAFLAPPHCAVCGHPFAPPMEAEALCASCVATAPPFARARAVFRYDESSKALVLRLKHADRLEGAPAFARWMARAGAELLADAELLVPVPLHRWRLLARRYNQAAVLANELGRLAEATVIPDLLLRRRATPAMGHLGREQRKSNVRGAFAVAPRWCERVAGRRVLLIDDVFTTGATVGECAKVLTRAGASGVDVLTLGRVVLGE
ncbi:MAG: ComF family protein [Magnetospirillum sp.]|nr:ComF family protein [Magnetospirillum sp.]